MEKTNILLSAVIPLIFLAISVFLNFLFILSFLLLLRGSEDTLYPFCVYGSVLHYYKHQA